MVESRVLSTKSVTVTKKDERKAPDISNKEIRQYLLSFVWPKDDWFIKRRVILTTSLLLGSKVFFFWLYHIKILYQEYNKNNVVMLFFLCYCSDFKKITWCYTFHQYTCTFNINFCGFYCWNCNLKINVHWSAIFYNILYQLDHRPQIYYIAITLTFS